jgi:hypothetical protein
MSHFCLASSGHCLDQITEAAAELLTCSPATKETTQEAAQSSLARLSGWAGLLCSRLLIAATPARNPPQKFRQAIAVLVSGHSQQSEQS